MEQTPRIILRLGLGITFLWIGILILMAPAAWGNFISPWAAELLPVSIERVMIGTGILDIALGALLIIGLWTRIAALIAALHLAVVLISSGIDSVTVRDIGLLAAAIALSLSRPRQDIGTTAQTQQT